MTLIYEPVIGGSTISTGERILRKPEEMLANLIATSLN